MTHLKKLMKRELDDLFVKEDGEVRSLVAAEAIMSYRKCKPEIQKVAEDAIETLNDPDADEDDFYAALSTFASALWDNP